MRTNRNKILEIDEQFVKIGLYIEQINPKMLKVCKVKNSCSMNFPLWGYYHFSFSIFNGTKM